MPNLDGKVSITLIFIIIIQDLLESGDPKSVSESAGTRFAAQVQFLSRWPRVTPRTLLNQ